MPRRKLVTVLACDVSGSTAIGERLDPESVQDLMVRYFHTMRDALERHGGTVEKFIGDAVVAVFGVPVAHEDDALRACRAAVEMRDRIAELNPELERSFGATLAVRIGVATGEVVARDPAARETFVTGDAANVAARLEQAAPPGEILVSVSTYELAAHGVEAEPVEPIRAKGKAEAVPAYRMLTASAVPRLVRKTPLVGREHELSTLLAMLDGRAAVATVIGEPGVGKTRLVAEATSVLAERATVLVGRCLSYGEGITYWPLGEIVRTAARIYDQDSPQAARAKVLAVAGEPVGEPVCAAIGLPGSATGALEIAWAFRELFATLAERPLVLVVEDVHWAERPLLDLLSSVKGVEAPILVLLTARPELLDARPEWPVTLSLDPLSASDARRLAHHLGGAGERLVRASGGNPLFLEELHAFVRENPETQALPPTLTALLAARLDMLPEPERIAAECAAIEGEHFHRGAVAALSGDPSRLAALIDRGLIRPARAEFAGEAAFRFKHVLVRDAAYNAIAKRDRIRLHEAFADWLGGMARARLAEYDEILGYHLERAFRQREELGPPDEKARSVARRAATHLVRAAERGWDAREAAAGAASFFGRALDLLPWEERPPHVELQHWAALVREGNGEEAEARMDDALRAARGAGDRERELHVLLMRAYGWANDDENETAAALELAAEARDVFAASGNRLGLIQVHGIHELVYSRRGECAAALEATERAAELAREIGDFMWRSWFPLRRLELMIHGETPVARALELVRAESAEDWRPHMAHFLSFWQVLLLTMDGRFAETAELRAGVLAARPRMVPYIRAESHATLHRAFMLADDVAAAEAEARKWIALAEHPNVPLVRPALALAETLSRVGECDEAERWARAAAAEAQSVPNLVAWHILWRLGLARAVACQGVTDEAEALARAATALVEPTEWLNLRGEALLALGEITGEAEHVERARELYERKGNVVMAQRARERLAARA